MTPNSNRAFEPQKALMEKNFNGNSPQFKEWEKTIVVNFDQRMCAQQQDNKRCKNTFKKL